MKWTCPKCGVSYEGKKEDVAKWKARERKHHSIEATKARHPSSGLNWW